MQAEEHRLGERSREALFRRNPVVAAFFQAEAPRLAAACREMAQRFLAGGRLLAFGRGAAATDAQHVSVEFVHPVIVGKRALPALDLGPEFATALPVLVAPEDLVLGFAGPQPDPAVDHALGDARSRGALTFGLYSPAAEHAFTPPTPDPFVCQEVAEVLYHLLWESVHVFFEHRERGHDVGASAFLYPFLGQQAQSLDDAEAAVRESICQKAGELNTRREEFAARESAPLAAAAWAIHARLQAGGRLLTFGNGGSATDANDFALDCVSPPPGLTPLPAISLAFEPAMLTALANDIGVEALFSRQLIAHARPEDVVVAFSTSGGSANLLAALAEARRRRLLTVVLAGYDGGRIKAEGLADYTLVVRSEHVPRIQEVQASAYHVLRVLLQQFSTEARGDA
jgi:D-sedoheptulose 7-phosphate isomerase